MHGLGPSFSRNYLAAKISLDSRKFTVNAKSTPGHPNINLDAATQQRVGPNKRCNSYTPKQITQPLPQVRAPFSLPPVRPYADPPAFGIPAALRSGNRIRP